jgi:hypothetical protein
MFSSRLRQTFSLAKQKSRRRSREIRTEWQQRGAPTPSASSKQESSRKQRNKMHKHIPRQPFLRMSDVKSASAASSTRSKNKQWQLRKIIRRSQVHLTTIHHVSMRSQSQSRRRRHNQAVETVAAFSKDTCSVTPSVFSRPARSISRTRAFCRAAGLPRPEVCCGTGNPETCSCAGRGRW